MGPCGGCQHQPGQSPPRLLGAGQIGRRRRRFDRQSHAQPVQRQLALPYGRRLCVHRLGCLRGHQQDQSDRYWPLQVWQLEPWRKPGADPQRRLLGQQGQADRHRVPLLLRRQRDEQLAQSGRHRRAGADWRTGPGGHVSAGSQFHGRQGPCFWQIHDFDQRGQCAAQRPAGTSGAVCRDRSPGVYRRLPRGPCRADWQPRVAERW